MLELMRALSGVSGVSSREEDMRALIRALALPWADEVREDPLGSLIVRKKGKNSGKSLLLSAFMDECGVMVSDFTEQGFVRFQTVGQVDRRCLIGKRVLLGERALPGVIGMKPVHLSSKEERKSVPKTKDLYIDIGARSIDEARSRVEPGDVGFFPVSCGPFGEGLWRGGALESRIPCAVLLRLLREELSADCTFVFAAQAQVGNRGALAAAGREKPDAVLCLYGAQARDLWHVPENQRENRLGGGVVLPVSDRGAMYDRELFERLRSLAEEQHIPWQIQAADPDRSDAGAYVCAGIPTAGLALPVRYCHAPVELAALSDAQAMLDLCRSFVTAEEERG